MTPPGGGRGQRVQVRGPRRRAAVPGLPAAGVLVAGVLAAVMLAAACSTGADGDPDSALTHDDSSLVWSPCGSGAQCTTVTVPVDSGDPTGPHINLAVTRRPATEHPPDKSQPPVVFVNPGGPGVAAGRWLGATTMFAGLGRYADVVSWDPRGTGDSTPLDCDAPGVPDATQVQRTVDTADGLQELVAACIGGSPDVVARLGNDYDVADLDAIRAALGIDRISYLGFSWGSYLGLGYAARFGDRVDAMVLDGIVDPAVDLEGLLVAQAEGLERLVDRIGADPDGGRHLVDVLYDDPAVDNNVVAFAAIAAGYDPARHDLLRRALTDATGGDTAGLERLAGSYWDAVELPAYLGTLCVDLDAPRRRIDHIAMRTRLVRTAGRLGGAIADETAGCALWPRPDTTVTSPSPPPPGAPAPPIMVVGATGDLATPLGFAQSVHNRWPNTRLVIHDADHHTSYGTSACVRRAADAHLSGAGHAGPVAGTTLRCPG